MKGKQGLQRVLRAYAAYDPEVNYCQGMNFLAALLLIWMPSEAEAFGGLVVLMQERGLRELYTTDMSALQVLLPSSPTCKSFWVSLLSYFESRAAKLEAANNGIQQIYLTCIHMGTPPFH